MFRFDRFQRPQHGGFAGQGGFGGGSSADFRRGSLAGSSARSRRRKEPVAQPLQFVFDPPFTMVGMAGRTFYPVGLTGRPLYGMIHVQIYRKPIDTKNGSGAMFCQRTSEIERRLETVPTLIRMGGHSTPRIAAWR